MNKSKTLILLVIFILLTGLLTGCGKKTQTNQNINQNPDAGLIQTEDGTYASEELQKQILDEEKRVQDVADKQLNDDYNLVRELEDSEDAKKNGSSAKGSCNAIAEASTCLEYYGSFWSDLQIQLNCSDSGVYSKNPCPRDFAGGCNTGQGTQADMVAWMYTHGGGEITSESIPYAQMACDATMGSKWINTK